MPYPWLTDTVLANWFNNKATPYRPLGYMVQVLVDIVSKNGCMLLDVSPAADGTIPDQARTMLLGLGDWLKINGEAIYGTRPGRLWRRSHARQTGADSASGRTRILRRRGLRFTQSKDGEALYAISLGVPKETVSIKALAAPAGKVAGVALLGSRRRL